MIPRGILDITYTDVFRGLYYCFLDFIKIKEAYNTPINEDEVICLSVRSGFDVLLSALDLPIGSEIIVTCINIPDMFAIITAHQLVAVPLPINKNTLSISPQHLKEAVTPNTKAILITHLFGVITDLDEIVAIAKEYNIMVIEDRAQAFAGPVLSRNILSDVIMFSFGLIKTNTTVSGALLQIKYPSICSKVIALNRQSPTQRSSVFFKKLFKVLVMKILTAKVIYTLFYKICIAKGKDFDAVLSGFTKGFPGESMLVKIRFQPCAPNIRLINYRLKNFKADVIDQRKKLASDILKDVSATILIGACAKQHNHWVLPVKTEKTAMLIDYLRSNGFDATQKASSLVKLSSPVTVVNDDELNLENLVYLPMYPGMNTLERNRLAALLKSFASA
ncbi:aminotransferase class V-fold PLP-dependent enzyme [Mucilaginibacter sp.]|uniref:aminotransferase class V-fold PLP-dependent enzyme n=1 Tax=Mucilaginibacter sp. TaxID=1882438 RepID=UPI0025DA63CE|nr:aminotransferase class V-fold PLP-dependent enzyme [Mucilaginibacter sp.]